MNKLLVRVFILAVFLTASVVGTPAAFAQSDEICITVDGHEVCGQRDTIMQLFESTATPEATGTPVATPADEASAEATVVTNANMPVLTGFPESVTPYRLADGGETHEQVSSIEGTEFLLGDPGVISADTPADCEGNESCIVINPNTQSLLWSETATLLCPEGGYLVGFAATVAFSAADWSVTLPRAEDKAWGFAIRCPNEGPGDKNLSIEISDFDPGAILITRFPVPADAGAFMSAEYIQQNVDAAHASQNCGGGSDGCDTVSFFGMDSNDLAEVSLSHTEDAGWEPLSTNVVLED